MNNEYYEMYRPNKKRQNSMHHGSNFNINRFFRKYINFRIQYKVKPYFMQFLLIFIIGIILNFVYYQTFSLYYLFIGGVNEWFSILIPILNGFYGGYDLFYLIINGIYYGYFYYYLTMLVFSIVNNLDKRDTWVMMGWLTAIFYVINKIIPIII